MSYGTAPAWPRNGGRAAARRWCCCTRTSRTGGAARELALEMNAVIIANGEAEADGACGVDAWHRLAEITVPVTVACGDLDVPFIVDRCRQLAGRLPAGRHVVLVGMAHQPYLESASTVAQLIRSAVTGG